MASALYQQVEQLSRDKGIDPAVVVSAVEDAYLAATRKHLKTQEELESRLNKDTGEISVYAVKKVVEEVAAPATEISLAEARELDAAAEVGGEVRIKKSTEGLGRIAAQMAKQIIFQKVREAERDTVYNEYISRVGEVVNVTVKRTEGPDVVVELGHTEGRLGRRDQSRLESFANGERIRVVIRGVEKAAKGPQVAVSRADPALVQKLFEAEVPEIYDGTVVIKGVAREAGERTKIAVFSRDKDVDCVGACVGMKGMRVQSIIRELRGEKIDIIEFNDDPVQFAANALSPAKISRVSILDAEAHHLEVVVDDTQLSLAIGKKGQNVRLAAKLLGWKIDIKSEEEKRREVEEQMSALVGEGEAAETPLSQLQGLSERIVAALAQAGIGSVEQLGSQTPEQLQQIPGIGPKAVEKIFVAVNQFFGAMVDASATAAGESPAAPALTETPENELDRTGQEWEAEQQRGVLDAPLADAAELPARDGLEPAADSAAAGAEASRAEEAGAAEAGLEQASQAESGQPHPPGEPPEKSL
ncbi:MAG TPA: transcription termination factor NusA [Terriglobales bacterium]|nr:transcription termination factor NusA [Terriglobales bacterium]